MDGRGTDRVSDIHGCRELYIHVYRRVGREGERSPLLLDKQEHASYRSLVPGGRQKNVDISDQSGGFANFDYLYSNAPFEFGKPVTLQFKHLMAKIRVELTTADNIGVQKVEILSYPTVNYKEGLLTTSGKGYITACRDSDTGNYEAPDS